MVGNLGMAAMVSQRAPPSGDPAKVKEVGVACGLVMRFQCAQAGLPRQPAAVQHGPAWRDSDRMATRRW